MEIYDYNEDSLATIAGNCRYLNCKKPRSADVTAGISCRDCGNWTGKGCARKHLDGIAAELQLD